MGGEEKQWRSKKEERRSSAGEEGSIEGTDEEQLEEHVGAEEYQRKAED